MIKMHQQPRINDSVNHFMNELTSRIVAKSGIPTDRFHLGKLILQSLKDAPDFVSQIDGGTNAQESAGSVLARSVRCARALHARGLRQGDVIALMGPNHLDLCIPYYAALYLGVIAAPVDANLVPNELQNVFKITEPKIIFCQSEKYSDIQLALGNAKLSPDIVTFDDGIGDTTSFTQFLDTGDGTSIDEFKATNFDASDATAVLLPTSGTTGFPKHAALTHKNLVSTSPCKWSMCYKFPTPVNMLLMPSTLQWISGLIQFNLSPIMRITRLQTSKPATPQHLRELINNYKPQFMPLSPILMSSLIKYHGDGGCDFSCFEMLLIGGSAVTKELLADVKALTPKTFVIKAYGATEVCTYFVFFPGPEPQSFGSKARGPLFNYRLVDPVTGRDIDDANVQGELWLQGPGVFKEYYKNPSATAEVFTADGWFKTGDLFYRDERYNFHYVERIKMLLKYKGHQVSPAELEAVIKSHPGVADAAVGGAPDPECGELPVACVVRRPTAEVTARQITDLVKESLSDAKQLRGGVIFLDRLPMTPSVKVDRKALRDVILRGPRVTAGF